MGIGGFMKDGLRALAFFALGSLTMTSCSSKSGSVDEQLGQETSSVVISNVSFHPEADSAQVDIKSSREPKYNVFKLQEPERIVIDIIDAKLGDEIPANIAGNEFVQEVKVQALEDSLSALVRIEVVLKDSANYVAELTSDGLALKVLKSGVPIPEKSNPEGQVPMAGEVTVPPEVQANAGNPNEAAPEKSVEGDSMAKISPDLSVPLPAPEVAPLPAPVVPEVKSEVKPDLPVIAEAPPVAPLPLPPLAGESSASTAIKDEKKDEKKEIQVEAKADLAPAEPEEQMSPPPTLAPAEVKKSGKKKGVSLKPVEDQEISSVLTEGTSLLTELDAKVYTGRRVSLEFQETDVQDILRLIADVSKLNIVTGDDVKGKLSLKLIDVPWDQALDIILTTLGLDKTQHGNIIRVAPSDKLRKEREVALANDKAAKQLEPLKLRLLNVNYAKADELAARIKNLLSERGSVDTDTRTNTLIVKDIREHLSRVENLVRALDTQTPQVRIEARIVQANDQFTKNLGIQWGPTLHLDGTNSKERPWEFPRTITAGGGNDSATFAIPGFAVDALPGTAKGGALGFRLGSVSNIFNLDLQLQYLEQESLGRVVSRPSISVLDNKSASIIQGSKVPFTSSSANSGTSVSFQDVGISINVTPQITSDGSVIMKVHTSANEILDTAVGGNPITTTRESNTEMLVRSGKTSVLGGVFKTSDTSAKGGVPGLYNLPVLGWLFGNSSQKTTREETLVFITPYILNDTRVSATGPNSETTLEQ